ncbi:MAG: DUF983 domain-containing protein [Proteobacteria bacterium]|nr:DUF983 domain-containing protein [Pseudomonadota bacterium]
MPIAAELAGSSAAPVSANEPRSLGTALARGARLKCPACGQGQIFNSYLKVAHDCDACGEALHHQRADDAPAYVTITIVGHIVVAGLLMVEKAFAPPTWVQLAIWLPMTVILSLALLPVVKGLLVSLQWALRMHGFGLGRDPADPLPDPAIEAGLPARGPAQ